MALSLLAKADIRRTSALGPQSLHARFEQALVEAALDIQAANPAASQVKRTWAAVLLANPYGESQRLLSHLLQNSTAQIEGDALTDSDIEFIIVDPATGIISTVIDPA